VVGWGTVKIPSSNKSSIAYNALLVRRQTIAIDSFYLGTNPAPLAMLSAFGTKQNDSIVTYGEFLYRAGTGTPVMSFGYADNTYSTPASVSYDADNVQSGIDNEGYDPDMFRIFPNPSAGIVNFQINKTSELPWNLSLVNMLGQTVKTAKISGSGMQDMQIEMSGSKAGLYYVHLTDELGNVLISSKLEIAR
jgi:hypothetical protein